MTVVAPIAVPVPRPILDAYGRAFAQWPLQRLALQRRTGLGKIHKGCEAANYAYFSAYTTEHK